jgi:hypothetical protein
MPVGTLNLLIDIAALPDGGLRVGMRAPAGEASADLASPFTADELARFTAVFSGSAPVSDAEHGALARQLGDRLFAFLFRTDDGLRALYIATLERAAAGDMAVRVRISAGNAGAFGALPFEALRDPARDVLAFSRSTPVVRSPQFVSFRPPRKAAAPLRVLAVFASPADFPALDTAAEWARLNTATARAQGNGLLVVERLEPPTLAALRHRLREGEFHIVHFVGHGTADARGAGMVAFEDGVPGPDGRAGSQIVTGSQLGREIGEETSVRLVVLNACQTATDTPGDPLEGLASTLTARGIPAVVGMQYPIGDRAAQVFSEEFYRALTDGLPIDGAMSDARRAIAAENGRADWVIPALFLRAETADLFDMTDTREPAARPLPEAPDAPAATRDRRPFIVAAGGLLAVLALALLVVLGAALNSRPPTPTAAPPTETRAAADAPDLTVTGVRVSPRRPAPGEFFRVNITITNSGDGDSGPFSYTWDSSITDPVQLNSFLDEVLNIAPGASRSVSFPFIYGWWGTYNTQVVIDAQSEVGEADELNNRRPLAITLADLPFALDFSLIPPIEVVEPPFTVTADTFAAWNLVFALDAPGCADALIIAALGDGDGDDSDLALQPDPAREDCANAPLRIRITRGPVRGGVLELVGLAGTPTGETVRVEGRGETGTLVFADDDVLAAEAAISIGEETGAPTVHELVLVGEQGVRWALTRLVLFSPNPPET